MQIVEGEMQSLVCLMLVGALAREFQSVHGSLISWLLWHGLLLNLSHDISRFDSSLCKVLLVHVAKTPIYQPAWPLNFGGLRCGKYFANTRVSRDHALTARLDFEEPWLACA